MASRQTYRYAPYFTASAPALLANKTTMPSNNKEDGAAKAAQQLGSMSLGESAAGKKDNDTENNEAPAKVCSACGEKSDALKKCTACKSVWYCDVACQKRHRTEHRKECNRIKKELVTAAEPENNEDDNKKNVPNGSPTKLCSACGKKSDTLKKCSGCLCVWYCDKDCLNRHRKEHKKECKRIKKALDKRGGKLALGTEQVMGPLGKLPLREECPICMQALPIYAKLHSYYTCCGKTICGGCMHQHKMKSGESLTCAFCRTKLPESDKESLVQLRKRVKLKDPSALFSMSLAYGYGTSGLPLNQTKCLELLREAVDLGSPSACYELGNYYATGAMGLQQNVDEGFKYWEKAAEGGHLLSRHNLTLREGSNGDPVAAVRHIRLAASGGFKMSMVNLIEGFESGFIQHGVLAETLQAFYLARAELKSEGRGQYIQHLKMTGKYEAAMATDE